jgi:hypothetical protein
MLNSHVRISIALLGNFIYETNQLVNLIAEMISEWLAA